MIITGTLSGLHLGGYYLTKADILATAGLSNEALTELHHFSSLVERTYDQDETRNRAWSDIVYSKVLLNLKEYSEATNRAKTALIACQTIHSRQNVAIIADLYRKLTYTPYAASKNVQELGDMLEHHYDL